MLAQSSTDASTFNSVDDADHYIEDALRGNEQRITDWLLTSETSIQLTASFGSSVAVGRLLQQGDTVVRTVNNVLVLLLRAPPVGNLGFHVYTA